MNWLKNKAKKFVSNGSQNEPDIKEKEPKTHPQNGGPIEFAFEIGGEKYYQFKNLLDSPVERYYRLQQFMIELEMRITREELIRIVDKCLENYDKGEMAKIAVLLTDLKNRTEFLIETDTFYRLASATFFTLDENIFTYDFDYNEDKINTFKKEKISDFFFRRPVKKLIPHLNISPKDLELYLKASKAVKLYESQLLRGQQPNKNTGINSKS